MFNLLPAQGLGGAGLLAFGLAPVVVVVVIPETHPSVVRSSGGGMYIEDGYTDRIRHELIRQQILRDDQEIMDMIVIIVKSGIL